MDGLIRWENVHKANPKEQLQYWKINQELMHILEQNEEQMAHTSEAKVSFPNLVMCLYIYLALPIVEQNDSRFVG